MAVTILVFCVAALLALGMVMLYSSSMTQINPHTHESIGAHFLEMQLAWCTLGLGLAAIATSLDYRKLKQIAWPTYAFALLMLLAVLVIGRRINGAKRWFDFHGVRFQPSEFAKLALLIVIAWYVDRYPRQMKTWWRGIVIPGAIISVGLGLIFVEPDRGTTILLACVTGTMLLVAGVRWKFIVPPAIVGVCGLVVSILHDPMRMKRIFSWIDLEQHKDGVGYQAYQAMLALGSGGWFGRGIGNGRQKLFVPEDHTDFILSIIGEELGLVATLLIVVTFVVIVLCGIYIAIHSRDNFGLLLGCGITFLIGMQALINIGVVTSALPNKGLPLPFISYGGSNLMMMLVSVGVLLSIARFARQPSNETEAVAPGKIPSPELS
ncbi:MAG TPA: putative lipid II flippase FtsW [Verrucomicrobiae bacterium]|nr:putative lipid II flippase FtsW [Verrucomicrobiae bacterium]